MTERPPCLKRLAPATKPIRGFPLRGGWEGRVERPPFRSTETNPKRRASLGERLRPTPRGPGSLLPGVSASRDNFFRPSSGSTRPGRVKRPERPRPRLRPLSTARIRGFVASGAISKVPRWPTHERGPTGRPGLSYQAGSGGPRAGGNAIHQRDRSSGGHFYPGPILSYNRPLFQKVRTTLVFKPKTPPSPSDPIPNIWLR
jgi:hypothetical protein